MQAGTEPYLYFLLYNHTYIHLYIMCHKDTLKSFSKLQTLILPATYLVRKTHYLVFILSPVEIISVSVNT